MQYLECIFDAIHTIQACLLAMRNLGQWFNFECTMFLCSQLESLKMLHWICSLFSVLFKVPEVCTPLLIIYVMHSVWYINNNYEKWKKATWYSGVNRFVFPTPKKEEGLFAYKELSHGHIFKNFQNLNVSFRARSLYFRDIYPLNLTKQNKNLDHAYEHGSRISIDVIFWIHVNKSIVIFINLESCELSHPFLIFPFFFFITFSWILKDNNSFS